MSREEVFDRIIVDGLSADEVEQWLREAFRAGRELEEQGYGISAEDEYVSQFFKDDDGEV